jgi:hypothetical protein
MTFVLHSNRTPTQSTMASERRGPPMTPHPTSSDSRNRVKGTSYLARAAAPVCARVPARMVPAGETSPLARHMTAHRSPFPLAPEAGLHA